MIYITLGDPLSVNIECLNKIGDLFDKTNMGVTFIGDYHQWEEQNGRWGSPIDARLVDSIKGLDPSKRNFVHVETSAPKINTEALSSRHRGEIALGSLETLKRLDLTTASILTGPIDKSVCHHVGFSFPGQTEFCESMAGSQGIMILAGPKLKVGLVTNHLPISQIANTLTEDLVYRKLRLLAQTMGTLIHSTCPRIAVVGLNPHCGDGGAFGVEDQEIVLPAIEKAKKTDARCKQVVGPIPADTAFFRCLEGEFDAVLAMYHDQGLGPLKTAHFYDAVNITGGLPFLRVSPDHGPAADRFGSNSANPASFREALKLCIRRQHELVG